MLKDYNLFFFINSDQIDKIESQNKQGREADIPNEYGMGRKYLYSFPALKKVKFYSMFQWQRNPWIH